MSRDIKSYQNLVQLLSDSLSQREQHEEKKRTTENALEWQLSTTSV